MANKIPLLKSPGGRCASTAGGEPGREKQAPDWGLEVHGLWLSTGSDHGEALVLTLGNQSLPWNFLKADC